MHWSPDMMKRAPEGIRIETPKGDVWLHHSSAGIVAEYAHGPLLNGTAIAYAHTIKQAALDYAHSLEFPWSSDSKGRISIKDHRRFYEQSFRPDLLAAETLLRWELQSCVSQTGI